MLNDTLTTHTSLAFILCSRGFKGQFTQNYNVTHLVLAILSMETMVTFCNPHNPKHWKPMVVVYSHLSSSQEYGKFTCMLLELAILLSHERSSCLGGHSQ